MDWLSNLWSGVSNLWSSVPSVDPETGIQLSGVGPAAPVESAGQQATDEGAALSSAASNLGGAWTSFTNLFPSSTSITVWLVLIVIGLLAFAYITRETVG